MDPNALLGDHERCTSLRCKHAPADLQALVALYEKLATNALQDGQEFVYMFAIQPEDELPIALPFPDELPPPLVAAIIRDILKTDQMARIIRCCLVMKTKALTVPMDHPNREAVIARLHQLTQQEDPRLSKLKPYLDEQGLSFRETILFLAEQRGEPNQTFTGLEVIRQGDTFDFLRPSGLGPEEHASDTHNVFRDLFPKQDDPYDPALAGS